MNVADVAHIAGLLDGSGTINVQITEDDTTSLGYRYRPYVTIHRPLEDKATIGKLDAYAEECTANYNLIERDTTMQFRVSNVASIERFLLPLAEWLVTRQEAAQIMLNKIVPRVEAGDAESKDGFYELVGVADNLRKSQHSNRPTKYTQEHFADVWDC